MTTYYKFTTKEGIGAHSRFNFKPYLPKNGKPGKWLPEVKHPEKCVSGYHACAEKDILEWLNARMFEVEYKDAPEDYGDKVSGRAMRFVRELPGWNKKNQRLAACDIAEQISMKVWNKRHPKDKRPQNAIDVARKYANGKATKDEMAAARDAAWDAAWAAARDEAWAAAKVAARVAAWDAAWAAAGVAAGVAAKVAAGDAALGAAWATARAAAWDAAEAAARTIIMRYANKKA